MHLDVNRRDDLARGANADEPMKGARSRAEDFPLSQAVPISGAGAVVLAHHWMEFFRGGEAVLEEFGELFPSSAIFFLVFNAENLPTSLRSHPIHGSFLQRFRSLRLRFRYLLPLFPEIIRSVHLPARTRFVLSSDASMIKGIAMPENAIHVCYCHSPPRYVWGLEDAYLESTPSRVARRMFASALPRLRRFDRRMADRVDRFIANSWYVQQRIRRHYDRDSVVINPPVNVEHFDHRRPREDFYLVVSALVPYKRVDLAVEACTRTRRRLVVIGTGPEEKVLRGQAGPTVTFLGWQANDAVKDHLERCRALLFPGLEDFGIVPCEAQAAGAPVLAYGEGGARETICDGLTGLFFEPQSVDALIGCLERFEASPAFSALACRANVAHLQPARFRRQIRAFLESEYPALFTGYSWPEERQPSQPAKSHA